MRQFAVVRPACHIEIHVAGRVAVGVLHHVGVPVADNPLDELDHVGDMPGRTRLDCRRQHAERIVGAGELTLVVIRARPPLLACGGGLIKDLVVDIGHVAHESHVIAQTQHPAADDVEGDGGADMPDMRGALHRRTTHVDPHMAGTDRPERRHGMRGGVVQIQPGGGSSELMCAGNVGILRFFDVSHTHERIRFARQNRPGVRMFT